MAYGIEPEYELAGYEYKAIDLDDYQLPETDGPELVEALKDPLTRICNIYTIVNKKTTKAQKFVPNWAQRVVLYAIYILGCNRILLPKARQLGMSTLSEIILFDRAYFGRNRQCSIVERSQPDANEKLDICRLAYKHLAPMLREGSAITADNKSEMSWGNDSSINAGKNARGGMNTDLHASELGVIAFEDPKRADEIISGAFPSVPVESGLIIAESTFKGGKGGEWYNLINTGLSITPEYRTFQDWLVLFFPWYLDPTYTREGSIKQIDRDTMKYLTECDERLGFNLTDGQKLWYFKEKQVQKKKMFREYPTFIEEMWKVREPGTIFAEAVDKQRARGKINDGIQHYEGFPVYTSWDIGAPLNTVCWIWQQVGDRIKFLECLYGSPDCATPAQWAKRLKLRTEYAYGGHFLPHDGETLWVEAFNEAELKHAVVVPRCTFVWDPINDALASFSRCEFNSDLCEQGLNALEAYRSKQESDGATIQNVPVHDWASHPSKAFECAHAAMRHGLVVDRSAIPSRAVKGNAVNVIRGHGGRTEVQKSGKFRRFSVRR